VEAKSSVISNPERVERLREALRKSDLDAFLCTLAVHVLMISGYSPVIGTSFAIVSRDGKISLLIPKDEEQFVSLSWADHVETYEPSSLKRLSSPMQAALRPLRKLLREHGIESATIGYEHGPTSQPSTYSAVHIFGESILDLLRAAAPNAKLLPADRPLGRLASIKTSVEIDRVRIACAIAANAFDGVKEAIVPDATEPEVAAALRRGFSMGPLTRKVQRTGGCAFCMAGENSAKASGAFALTDHREIRERDLVLIHCNSFADGYWTDITRTYVCGSPGIRERHW
jgi:Xaa-Pro aminopeptidase